MIVSESLQSQTGLVVLQSDHAELAYQMALAFGNQDFDAPEPQDLMTFLARHHDRGWDQTDDSMGRNPKTGLPYHLVSTPLDELLLTGPRSVEFNARYHPYCGLLCCMHVWGLFNGRYGLSDKVVVDMLQGEAREKAELMLHGMKKREAELIEELQTDSKMKPYIAPDKIKQNYMILQFFDTFSLYFNESAGRDHKVARFLNVPMTTDQTTTIQVQPVGQKTFRLTPYPFAEDGLELRQTLYEVPILDQDVSYRKFFNPTYKHMETLTLVS